MEINKKNGSVIDLSRAIELTHSYQEMNPLKANSYFVGFDRLDELLQQNQCVGMRIYPGLDNTTNQINMVLVGVDKSGEDMTSGLLLDELVTCPPMCPKESQLVKIN